MTDVFLSYSREDQVFARRFAGGFEREGLSVWWDQSLNPGEAFDQVTERALEEASAVIVLWSKSSVSSRWVRSEATQANANQRLVPVMIESCKRPIMFELTHTADLSEWKGNIEDPAWQAFVASVRQFVQRAGPVAGAPLAPARETRSATPDTRKFVALEQAMSALRRFLTGRIALGIAFALIGAGIAGSLALRLRPQGELEITRFSVDVAGVIGAEEPPAMAPDGRRIVYSIARQLYSRRLDQDEATPIPGASDAANPFFSPDGRSVAFFTPTQLKAFEFGGESMRVIADVKPAPGLIGTWDEYGRIYFGQSGPFGLSWVPAVGGVPEAFADRAQYADLDYPDVLPGGKWVLFTACIAQGDWSGSDIVAQNVATGERKVLLKGGHFARYLPTGHLVFARAGTLYAVAFDANRVEVRGRPVPVVQGVATSEVSGNAAYSVSAGNLVYTPGTLGGGAGAPTSVARLSRTGEPTVFSTDARDYSNPRLSPDGSRIAVEVAGSDKATHIWIMDATGAATQLTFEGDENRYSVWTADGREVLFASKRGAEFTLYRKAADGTGEARRVLDGSSDMVPTDVHGHTLVFQERGEGGRRDVLTLDLEGDGKPQPLLASPADESSARISPDGKWIAYVSIVPSAGVAVPRVYVRPFPDSASGGQRALSEGSGIGPVWSRTSDEIYYISISGAPGPLVSVPLAVTPTTITPKAPRELFALLPRFDMTLAGTLYSAPYDALPNGGFIAVEATAPTPTTAVGTAASASRPRMHVVLNWFEELRRLVPAE